MEHNDRESTIEARISEYERRWNYFSSILATSELSKDDDGFGVALPDPIKRRPSFSSKLSHHSIAIRWKIYEVKKDTIMGMLLEN
jgi:hypothetical protein